MPVATANPARADRSLLIEPKVLMGLRQLELRARVVVEGFWSGLHRSPYHGFSVEFTEYRQYSPGDDPRHVDWRVFARSDRLYLKRFEDETNLRCHLVVDQSRSMSYGSLGWTKADYAGTLAASLARLLDQQGDAVGLLTFDEAVRDYLPPRHRVGQLRRLTLMLEAPPEGRGTQLTAPLRRVTEIVRKRGLVVLISDFLAPLADLEQALAELFAHGHEVIVFQVLDPAEVGLGLSEAAVYEDLETGRTLMVDPRAARGAYRRRLEAHCAELRGLCERLGGSCVRLVTDTPLELALHDFLRARMRQGRVVRRTARRRHGGGRA